MSDEEDFQYSDDDFDERKHDKLVERVLGLNKTQNLKKPSRTEPTLQISEFDLVRSVTGKTGSVQVDELTKVLKNKKKHIQIGKRLESTNRKARTLPKPLEKPQSERIRRSVGYEKNRFLFDRWEAFVLSNRAQSHQVFPLDSVEKINIEAKQAIKFPETWSVKSDLQRELEKLDEQVEEYHIADENDNNEFPLTLQELKEKRKEAAKLRAHQSFKEAKARKQNKIKSKKYHRILRKEKIKQKLKEFEELQKSNPEEALKKLEEIEKARALERFSLRHKSTGQWAKSKQFRAKYDKESRQVLAQQLQISRDLTQKVKHTGSDSEDEGLETEETSNIQHDENPWVNGPKPDQEVSEFLSGYKKFWTDHNKNEEKKKIQETDINNIEVNNVENKNGIEGKLNDSSENLIQDDIQQVQQTLKKKKKERNKSKLNKKRKNKKFEENNEEVPPKQLSLKKKKSSLNNSSGDWNIDDIFNHVEKKMEEKIKKKLKEGPKIKKARYNKASKRLKIKETNSKKIDLTIPSQRKKQIIDEELVEKPRNGDESNVESNNNVEKLRRIIGEGAINSLNVPLNKSAPSQDIDPEKFMNPKATNLDSALPNIMVEDENSEENSQKNIIMEAFEDNDIVQDFTKEKREELEKDKPKDIDLNLPGWGSWAGTGIDPKKQRKRRRFIVKMPEVMPRRDDNKGALILNEKAALKIKPHLVSEVPFPFKTVKDYEASIRSPIGNTFVPEIAFRKFIRPAVETKMGKIIEPATTSILMGKTKR